MQEMLTILTDLSSICHAAEIGSACSIRSMPGSFGVAFAKCLCPLVMISEKFGGERLSNQLSYG